MSDRNDQSPLGVLRQRRATELEQADWQRKQANSLRENAALHEKYAAEYETRVREYDVAITQLEWPQPLQVGRFCIGDRVRYSNTGNFSSLRGRTGTVVFRDGRGRGIPVRWDYNWRRGWAEEHELERL